MTTELSFRIDAMDDQSRRGPWLNLLRDVFAIDLSAYSALDIWHPGYRAFSYWAGDVIAANVSIRPLPLLMDGQIVPAAQLHAVATRPQWRRRGLFADLMTRVLAYADGRFDRLLLFTAQCDLYRPFGFRHLPQHSFVGFLDAAPDSAAAADCRCLDLADADDRALILALHAARTPVSRDLGLVDNGDIFIANAIARPDWQLRYSPGAHALVVLAEGSGRKRLIDVVAPAWPDAATIAAALDLSATDGEIEILFPPDRLPGDFRALPYTPEDDDHLMIRGPLANEGAAIMLPLTALS
ncbi:MAG: GNAT family N-acetyltransferase [Rhodospirillaceae bacterium]|nr:GNAT family N-acetyltransferase [Rhodospirillaceae bacterium]